MNTSQFQRMIYWWLNSTQLPFGLENLSGWYPATDFHGREPVSGKFHLAIYFPCVTPTFHDWLKTRSKFRIPRTHGKSFIRITQEWFWGSFRLIFLSEACRLILFYNPDVKGRRPVINHFKKAYQHQPNQMLLESAVDVSLSQDQKQIWQPFRKDNDLWNDIPLALRKSCGNKNRT